MYSSTSNYLYNALSNLVVPPSSTVKLLDHPSLAEAAYKDGCASIDTATTSVFSQQPLPHAAARLAMAALKSQAALQVAVERSTDLLAASVRSALRSFNPLSPTMFDTRVLVVGTHAAYRAFYMRRLRDFPDVAHELDPQSCAALGSQGGIYYATDAAHLSAAPPASFDAVLCFNHVHAFDADADVEVDVNGVGADANADADADEKPAAAQLGPAQLVSLLSQLVRPGGVMAGTCMLPISDELLQLSSFSPLSPSSSSSSSSTSFFAEVPSFSYVDPMLSSCLMLQAYRSFVESQRMFVSTCIDLKMEGNVWTQVADDFHDADSAVHLSNKRDVVCARFMATKLAASLPSPPATPSSRALAGIATSTNTATNTTDDLSRTVSALSLNAAVAAAPPVAPITASVPVPLSPSVPSSSPTLHQQVDADSATSTSTTSSNEVAQANRLISLSMRLSAGLQSLTSHESMAAPIVVSGVSLGLPNGMYPDRAVFDPSNFDALFRGVNFIQNLSTADKQRILDQNVCKVYKKDGKRIKYRLCKDSELVQLASKISSFDMLKEYPMIPAHVVEVLDTTYQLAIAAGIEALKDAHIPILAVDETADDAANNSKGAVSRIVGLPEEMRDSTGVIFASSFPSLDSMASEVDMCSSARARAEFLAELEAWNEQHRVMRVVKEGSEGANTAAGSSSTESSPSTTTTDLPVFTPKRVEYEYDRKLLFKLLVMANSQLAELIKARGPNTHINNACSGTTQAIAIAEDWIRVGRCSRVVVISADHATSHQLLPFLATGFLALGAATTQPVCSEAAVPFDVRRRGMILGAGAIGMVLETSDAALGRLATPKAELLGSCISNSAFHASLMDSQTTSNELTKFMKRMEHVYGFDRHEIARQMIYFAHETSTHSNGGCAKVELDALNACFGVNKHDIMLASTKGFTGHPMGVGTEDVVAVESLRTGRVPPIANHKQADPVLDIQPSQLPLGDNVRHDRQYVLRFAAGFGSQFAYVLYRKWNNVQVAAAVAEAEAEAEPASPQ